MATGRQLGFWHLKLVTCIAIPRFPFVTYCAYCIFGLIEKQDGQQATILDYDIWSLLPLFHRKYWRDLFQIWHTCFPLSLVVHIAFLDWLKNKIAKRPPSWIMTFEVCYRYVPENAEGIFFKFHIQVPLVLICVYGILRLIEKKDGRQAAILNFDIWSLLSLVFLKMYWRDLSQISNEGSHRSLVCMLHFGNNWKTKSLPAIFDFDIWSLLSLFLISQKVLKGIFMKI